MIDLVRCATERFTLEVVFCFGNSTAFYKALTGDHQCLLRKLNALSLKEMCPWEILVLCSLEGLVVSLV